MTWVNTYDARIKTAAEHYLGDTDWRLIKAQLYQESRLDPNAISPAGAQGIAQFMPATWTDMIRDMRMPPETTPFQPDFAIPALCFYMSELNDKWTAKRDSADRYALALASYNAGFGNLIEAQKLAGGAAEYHKIIERLRFITGRNNAKQTSDYVSRIFGSFVTQILEG